MAAGWSSGSFQPFVLREYSGTFPAELKKTLEKAFSRFDFASESTGLDAFRIQ